MKKVQVVMMLVLFGLSLVVAAAAYAADSGQGRYRRAVPATPTQPQTLTTPAAPAAGGTPGGPSGPDSFVGGCCQKPTPFPGWDCCDTRDCGWMKCGDAASMPPKKYR